jgi:hypothetical protein
VQASSAQAPRAAMSTIFLGDENGLIETISISSPAAYGAVMWFVTKFEIQGAQPPDPRQLEVKASDRPLLHIVLSCGSDDVQDVDMLLPVARSGIDIAGEARISGSAVELTKIPPARQ